MDSKIQLRKEKPPIPMPSEKDGMLACNLIRARMEIRLGAGAGWRWSCHVREEGDLDGYMAEGITSKDLGDAVAAIFEEIKFRQTKVRKVAQLGDGIEDRSLPEKIQEVEIEQNEV